MKQYAYLFVGIGVLSLAISFIDQTNMDNLTQLSVAAGYLMWYTYSVYIFLKGRKLRILPAVAIIIPVVALTYALISMTAFGVVYFLLPISIVASLIQILLGAYVIIKFIK